MAHHGDLPVVTPRRLADGDHEDLMAARAGAEPSVAAPATGDDGRPRSRLWIAATAGPPDRRPARPPARPTVFGFVDGADGTSVMVSAENENRPALVAEPSGGMPRHRGPHRRAAVRMRADAHGRVPGRSHTAGPPSSPYVTSGERTPRARTRSGRSLHEPAVWFHHYGAVPDPALLAGPEIGDGAALFTTQEKRVEDGGRPPYAYDHAYPAPIDLATADGRARVRGRTDGRPAPEPGRAGGRVLIIGRHGAAGGAASRW